MELSQQDFNDDVPQSGILYRLVPVIQSIYLRTLFHNRRGKIIVLRPSNICFLTPFIICYVLFNLGRFQAKRKDPLHNLSIVIPAFIRTISVRGVHWDYISLIKKKLVRCHKVSDKALTTCCKLKVRRLLSSLSREMLTFSRLIQHIMRKVLSLYIYLGNTKSLHLWDVALL